MGGHSCLVCRVVWVSNRLATCRSCWRIVPGHLQEQLMTAWARRVRDPRRHREVLAELLAWARDQRSEPIR